MVFEKCKGCSLLSKEYFPVCYIFEIEEAVEVCPCRDCLIKPTCSNICKEREAVYYNLEVKNLETILRARVRYEKTKNRNKSDYGL